MEVRLCTDITICFQATFGPYEEWVGNYLDSSYHGYRETEEIVNEMSEKGI